MNTLGTIPPRAIVGLYNLIYLAVPFYAAFIQTHFINTLEVIIERQGGRKRLVKKARNEGLEIDLADLSRFLNMQTKWNYVKVLHLISVLDMQLVIDSKDIPMMPRFNLKELTE